VIPFLVGVAIPPALFLIPSIRAGAVPDFIRDVFIMPGKQIAHSTGYPTLFRLGVGAAENAALVIGAFLISPKLRKWIAGLILLCMLFGLILAPSIPRVDRAIWYMIWVLLPTISIVGSLMLVRWPSVDEKKRSAEAVSDPIRHDALWFSPIPIDILTLFLLCSAACYAGCSSRSFSPELSAAILPDRSLLLPAVLRSVRGHARICLRYWGIIPTRHPNGHS
jgi:hypothetical protein